MRETWVRSLGSIPGFRLSPGAGHGNPLQYSCLGNTLEGFSPWHHKELDMTERISMHGLFNLAYYSLSYFWIINCIVSSFISGFIYLHHIFPFISQSSWQFVSFLYILGKQNILFQWFFYCFSSFYFIYFCPEHERVCVLSCIWLFATSWTLVHKTPLSMERSRQEYWSGLPLPTPGNLHNCGIKPESIASAELAGVLFTTESLGKSWESVPWRKCTWYTETEQQ